MNSSIHTKASEVLVGTYLRPDIVFDHGSGSILVDENGKQYLDFGAGIAVNALGHSDPAWVQAVAEQAAKLTHVSNLFHTRPQVELAEKLVHSCFADKVFFVNSGSEANETAIKFARKWARTKFSEQKTGLVAFTHSFHGRTSGSLSLTAKEKYRAPFEPLLPNVTFLEFNDTTALSEAINDNTCAVFVEPVQGEGGVYPADHAFLSELRKTCNKYNALLVFDEVQCGLGRTGNLWAHQACDVLPDMMTIAKPLAGGLPIGAALVTDEIAAVIGPGDHGSTFAAGPLTCAAGIHTFDRIAREDFLADVHRKSILLQDGLRNLDTGMILEVRGMGLLIGVAMSINVRPVLETAMQKGLILLSAGETVLRICPPLTITDDEIRSGLDLLQETLNALNTKEAG